MKKQILIAGVFACLSLGILLTNCGYKLSGFTKQIPDHIKTIIIPDFDNKTTRYQAEQYITFAVKEEFIKRSHLELVDKETRADAVLEGTISQFQVNPLSYTEDASSNVYQVTIIVNVRLIDLKSNEIIFEGEDVTFSDSYHFDMYGGDATAEEDFFSQETETLLKITREFAASLVTTILENF